MDYKELSEVYSEIIISYFHHETERAYTVADGIWLYNSKRRLMTAYLLQKKRVLKLIVNGAANAGLRKIYSSFNGRRVAVTIKKTRREQLRVDVIVPMGTGNGGELLFELFNCAAQGRSAEETIVRLDKLMGKFIEKRNALIERHERMEKNESRPAPKKAPPSKKPWEIRAEKKALALKVVGGRET